MTGISDVLGFVSNATAQDLQKISTAVKARRAMLDMVSASEISIGDEMYVVSPNSPKWHGVKVRVARQTRNPLKFGVTFLEDLSLRTRKGASGTVPAAMLGPERPEGASPRT